MILNLGLILCDKSNFSFLFGQSDELVELALAIGFEVNYFRIVVILWVIADFITVLVTIIHCGFDP